MDPKISALWQAGPVKHAFTPGEPLRTKLRNGYVVRVDLPPAGWDVPADAAAHAVHLAFEALSDLAGVVADVGADPDLSPAGRSRRVAEAAKPALAAISIASSRIERFAAEIDKREDKLLAVPTEHPTELPVLLRQQEVRTWFRGLPTDQQMALVAKWTAAPATYDEALTALLQSPVPREDAVQKVLREAWAAARRKAFPEFAAQIEQDRRSVEWGRLQVASLAAGAAQLARTHGNVDVLGMLLEARHDLDVVGVRVFGFTQADFDAAVLKRKAAAMAAGV